MHPNLASIIACWCQRVLRGFGESQRRWQLQMHRPTLHTIGRTMSVRTKSPLSKARRAQTRSLAAIVALMYVGGLVVWYFSKPNLMIVVGFVIFLSLPFLALSRSMRCPKCDWYLPLRKSAKFGPWAAPTLPRRCPNCGLDLTVPYVNRA